MSCLYCLASNEYSDEHVLTRALAGPGEDWVLRDVVCTGCNDRFSRYERAWTSEPGIAMMRNAFGPVGRTRRGQAYQFHPAELMFLEADGDPVSYEVDLLPGVTPRFRYQIVDSGEKVFPVASVRSDDERFANAWKKFIQTPEVTIQKSRTSGGVRYRVAILSLTGEPHVLRIEQRAKPAVAWWDTFPAGFVRSADPRMSLDPFERIRFRTRKLSQVPLLLRRIFSAGMLSSSGGVHEPGTYRIASRAIYDIDKINRAVAKTLVNYMVDQKGRAYVSAPSFRPLLDFCIGGADQPANGPFVGVVSTPTGLSRFDALPTERHGLALVSDGERVVGFLKLYGGEYYYWVHLGPSPNGQPFVVQTSVDYNGPGRVSV